MSTILWDRKGKKPLSSFETHREILIRLIGVEAKNRALNKHEIYENDYLIVDYFKNEWRARLKTAPRE